ncbi:MAG: hypothetical protein Q4B01_07775 [Eubacteriales bacterium]|nr:hypothetical protein [Eubacteriales bacterium]
MEKKNHLFDDSIQQRLNELKKEKTEPEKKSVWKKLPAILFAGIMVIAILLRYFV